MITFRAGYVYYHIDGPHAYDATLPAYPQHSQYENAAYLQSPPQEWSASAQSRKFDCEDVRKNTAANQIIVERYANNDINIITPKPTERSREREVVVIVEADSDVELEPVSRQDRGRSFYNRRRLHRPWGERYEDRLIEKSVQSHSKVSKWLIRNTEDDE